MICSFWFFLLWTLYMSWVHLVPILLRFNTTIVVWFLPSSVSLKHGAKKLSITRTPHRAYLLQKPWRQTDGSIDRPTNRQARQLALLRTTSMVTADRQAATALPNCIKFIVSVAVTWASTLPLKYQLTYAALSLFNSSNACDAATRRRLAAGTRNEFRPETSRLNWMFPRLTGLPHRRILFKVFVSLRFRTVTVYFFTMLLF